MGRVTLVGAGPGDPDLITLRGMRALERADAVVHDALAAQELLEHTPVHALRFDVGKRGHREPRVSQLEIEALLVELALEGREVVRLKGGDPFVFGRGGEEAAACARAGIPCEVVPGISSCVAAPGAAGIPVTDRRAAASFAVVTGHRDPASERRLEIEKVAACVDTLVILMGMARLEDVLARVERVRGPGVRAAAIEWATTKRQRSVTATVATLAARVREAGFGAPSTVVIGDAVGLLPQAAELPDAAAPAR